MLAPSTPKMWSIPIAARRSTMWSTTRCFLGMSVNTTGERLSSPVHRRPRIYSDRCSRTWPLSAETTCTAAIWSTGVEMLPAGVAVWPGSATQVASRVWLPSRPTTTIASVSWCAFSGARQTHFRLIDVPQCWLDSRHRRGQQVRPDLCHRLRGRGHLLRRRRGMTLDTDEHADPQHRGRGGRGHPGRHAGAAAAPAHRRQQRRQQLRRHLRAHPWGRPGASGPGFVDRGHFFPVELRKQGRHTTEFGDGLPARPGRWPCAPRIRGGRRRTATPTRMRHPTSRSGGCHPWSKTSLLPGRADSP